MKTRQSILPASLVLALHLSKCPRTGQELAALVEQPLAKVTAALSDLFHTKQIQAHSDTAGATQSQGTENWINAQTDASALHSMAQLLRNECPQASTPYYLSYLYGEGELQDFERVTQFLDAHLTNASAGILLYLELFITCLLRWGAKHQHDVNPQHVRYIKVVLCVQGMCIFSQQHTRLAGKLAPFARALAQNSGHTPFTGIITIFHWYLNAFTGDEHFQEAPDTVSAAATLTNVTDKDIQSMLPTFTGLFHYIRGEFHETLQCYTQSMETTNYLYKQYFMCFLFSVSQSAMYLRQYDLSMDIIKSVLRRIEHAENNTLEMLWRSHLSFALLRAGKLDEALLQLTCLLNAVSHTQNHRAAASAARGLAVYHYLQRNIDSAYRVLYNETMFAIHKGVPHAPFKDPLVLEVLYAFEQRGYPPIPRYELDLTIQHILNTPNLQLQGTVLRIQALRLRRRGAAPTEVAALLYDSLKALETSRDMRELTLTWHELANTLEVLGQHQSRELRLLVMGATGYYIDARTSYTAAVILTICGVLPSPMTPQAYIPVPFPSPHVLAERDIRPIIGEGLRPLYRQAKQVSPTDAPVLLLGETGVGKELLARYIHQMSGRQGAFVPVHLASTQELLFESELFGYEKGAFTGACKQKIGLFEIAHEGTMFIDEVADIPPNIQTKLLRVLQDQHFMRVGGTREIHSNFRLITATNKHLEDEVRAQRFREDLLYRIAVIPLLVPPLRQRRKDILPLVQTFMEHFSRRYNIPPLPLTEQQQHSLCAYDWPGNVRELRNSVERAVILHSPLSLTFALPVQHDGTALAQDSYTNIFSEIPTLAELEARYLRHILSRTNGQVNGTHGAEKLLKIKRSTLYAKLKKYGIVPKQL